MRFVTDIVVSLLMASMVLVLVESARNRTRREEDQSGVARGRKASLVRRLMKNGRRIKEGSVRLAEGSTEHEGKFGVKIVTWGQEMICKSRGHDLTFFLPIFGSKLPSGGEIYVNLHTGGQMGSTILQFFTHFLVKIDTWGLNLHIRDHVSHYFTDAKLVKVLLTQSVKILPKFCQNLVSSTTTSV